jgi:2-haloacid dehalogenase
MSFDPDAVETVTVDSYGTLVDPSAAVDALDDHVEDTDSISDLWRTKSIEYTMVGNFVDAYQPFYDMNRDALRYALSAHGVDLDDETVEEILAVYHELEVYEDVRDGIDRLIDGGYPVYVVSNGNPEMLESMVAHAEIGDLIEDAISAHEVRTFKPDVEIYRHAAARTGTPIESIAHVAGPPFDIQGSKHAGMQGVRLDRTGDPWGSFGAEPDLTVESFYEFADALGV